MFFLQVVALLLVVILQVLIIGWLLRREVSDRASQHIRLPTPQPPRAQGADGCQQAHIKFKDPSSFSGDAKEFKEFAFAMDLALESLAFQDKGREVDYVAGFLTGNTRLWYISSLEAGTSFPSRPSLKQALYLAHGPSHEQEAVRLDLFAITQTGCLSDYVMAFTRLSLQIPGLDEHSRALLFVRGLQPELKRQVLQEHPETLSHAVAAARTVQQARDMLRERVGQGPKDSNYKNRFPSARPPAQSAVRSSETRLRRLSDEEHAKCMLERRCFVCRQQGHAAANCPKFPPNAGGQ